MKELYSKNALLVCTIFGGPLTGWYMVYRNYLKLGLEEKAQEFKYKGLLLSLGILVIPVILPIEIAEKLPNSVLPIIYTAVYISYFTKEQAVAVEEKYKKGWGKYSFWHLLGITVLGLVAAILMYFVFAIVSLMF